jgi:hypothetical protein
MIFIFETATVIQDNLYFTQIREQIEWNSLELSVMDLLPAVNLASREFIQE